MKRTLPNSINIREMLARGYLPKELPRSFTSSEFAAFVERDETTLRSLYASQAATTNLLRPGGHRRTLSMPNPQSHLGIVRQLSQDWDIIRRLWQQAPISSSHPVLDTHRYLTTSMAQQDRPRERIRNRVRARYVVHGDISSCYNSIYTHSFTWSVVGKDQAKRELAQAKRERKSRPAPLDGLDRAVRAAQSGQSVGIPIGPDSSLVLAELVLSAVDVSLMRRLRDASPGPASPSTLPALRLIDDFEYYARTRSEAEDVRRHWEEALAEFELSCNVEKTWIAELPEDVEETAIRELRRFVFTSGSSRQTRSEIEEFYGLLWARMSEYPKLPLASYALGRLKNHGKSILGLDGECIDVYLDCALATVLLDPSALRPFANVLWYISHTNHKVNWDRISETLHDIITHHARLEHGVVVSWCLEILRFYELELDSEAAAAVAKMQDNPSLVLLCSLIESGRCHGAATDRETVASQVEVDATFKSKDWLIAYYLSCAGVLSPPDTSEDPLFERLHKCGVRFFDNSRSRSRLDKQAGAARSEVSSGDAYF